MKEIEVYKKFLTVFAAMYSTKGKVKLHKIWNRISWLQLSKVVKLVEIPKSNGGTRPLGIPAIGDRIV